MNQHEAWNIAHNAALQWAEHCESEQAHEIIEALATLDAWIIEVRQAV